MIAMYARISAEDQSTCSISDQIRQCRLKAGTSEVKEYVDDGYSGEYLERPALNQLREDVREGLITKVIVYDADRWSRNTMNALLITNEMERKGVEIQFVNHNYDKSPAGRLFYTMKLGFAEYERAVINDRTSRGRKQKAREGKVVKNDYTYGYDYDKESGQLIINEKEAQIVQLIFDLFTQPNHMVKGINGIAKYLTEKGIPTKRSARVWHKQVVRQILMNRTYTGVKYQNRWNTEGMLGNRYRPGEEKVSISERPREDWIAVDCPVIIEKFQFEQAQKLLGEARRRYAKESKNQYLLSGLLRCGLCGNTMTGRNGKNWGKYVMEYTDIKNTAGTKQKGCGNRVKCEELDAYVWETISNWLNQPEEVAAAMEEEQKERFQINEIEVLETKLSKIRDGRKRLIDVLTELDQGIGDADIRSKLRELNEDEKKTINKLEELRQRQEQIDSSEHTQHILNEAVDFYLSKKDNLSFEDKQTIIRHVVKEIKVYKDEIEIYQF